MVDWQRVGIALTSAMLLGFVSLLTFILISNKFNAKIKSSKQFIHGNATYKCKMINQLKEDFNVSK